jgi:hypothetical protein
VVVVASENVYIYLDDMFFKSHNTTWKWKKSHLHVMSEYAPAHTRRCNRKHKRNKNRDLSKQCNLASIALPLFDVDPKGKMMARAPNYAKTL